jgi:hypothetical protein
MVKERFSKAANYEKSALHWRLISSREFEKVWVSSGQRNARSVLALASAGIHTGKLKSRADEALPGGLLGDRPPCRGINLYGLRRRNLYDPENMPSA